MKQKYVDLIRESEESVEHWAEMAISDFTDELFRLMEKEGVSRAQIAEKIDSSPAYVTKVLRGNVNFTLLTMTKLARALGATVRVRLDTPPDRSEGFNKIGDTYDALKDALDNDTGASVYPRNNYGGWRRN